ncbi:MAG: GNAT family N-acetyltransferase [Nitriliruptor sp.]|nr:MAG: GNAT family N-acetyltransferase [Nitriliruptor sp.]
MTRTPASSRLRPLRPTDHAHLVALNDADVPRVGPLGRAGLDDLLPHCDLALVAERDGELAGFVLAIAPGAAYGSPNYRFFEARGTDHLYVDRLLTAPRHRRAGVASALSDAVEDRARATGRVEVTCEVNVRPANPASLAFHTARGFVEVGRQDTGGGAVTVALLARTLPPTEPNPRS